MGCRILDQVVGWEILWCPKCAYAIEKCHLTKNFAFCPICAKKGKEVRLEDRYVAEDKFLKPRSENG
ncbi:unnamed protein product [marine sediment metagenome]|uniref:Uncharacterized protein n=1 Tax=marine sediment metagenome TaxID=412755 RepID=X1LAB6_9ZZZZ